MDSELRKQLIDVAKEKISDIDVSHDFQHAFRVLSNAEKIAKEERADLDVVIPAALFHDLIVYPKDNPNRYKSQEESANAAEKILCNYNYSQDKIDKVKTCILECSFSKGIIPELLESKILQDADGLEATGAISIMRTYASAGQMQRPFYNPRDPFCHTYSPETSFFALDLFYERLLKVGDKMHTESAKKIAQRRTMFLRNFLSELELELNGE